MMKKMKGVALVPPVPVDYHPPYALFEDQRNRFKHQSLLQDYGELQKETEAMKQKLHMMKERKLMLLAEVRFLIRRHDFLIQNKLPAPAPTPTTAASLMERNQGKVLGIKTKTIKKAKNNRKESALKGKSSNSNSRFPPPLLDLNTGKEASLIDQKERIKEANVKPAFDLNQISVEEEELEGNDDNLVKTEEMKKNEQQNDVKLSICRSTGNVQNRVGKRKITWQDPVALRV